MRAETQNHIDAIEKSITLLKQRMDWDTAAHRMEEFNAMTEDPALWNDPEQAQKLMRERLAQTHVCDWNYDFVCEQWSLKKSMRSN